MKRITNKRTKKELRELMHLTRPPRLKEKARKAKELVKKPKKIRVEIPRVLKRQGYSEQERRDYQLKSKRR
ncbi:hypothetical protein HY968_05190 [Candidatus Kaiserbacteria bacterium]|nr:hypothetical protein [Candidatus Kaiserbacteria bacterium]